LNILQSQLRKIENEKHELAHKLAEEKVFLPLIFCYNKCLTEIPGHNV
jgi:hypothetical protein